MRKNTLMKATLATPAAPGTALGSMANGGAVSGLEMFDMLTFDVKIVGGTGGTTDVYLQKLIADASGTNVWADFVHFTQVTTGATSVQTAATQDNQQATPAANWGTDGSAGTPALAANSIAPGYPGSTLRLVAVAGTGTTVAGSVTLYITGKQFN